MNLQYEVLHALAERRFAELNDPATNDIWTRAAVAAWREFFPVWLEDLKTGAQPAELLEDDFEDMVQAFKAVKTDLAFLFKAQGGTTEPNS